MIRRPPLTRYFDVILTWATEVGQTGAFRALATQVRELRAIEAMIEQTPAEYKRALAGIETSIEHYGYHQGGERDLTNLRSVEYQFKPHPSRLHSDGEKQDFLASLVIDAYSLYEKPFGFSMLRGKTLVIEGDDRYVYRCDVEHRDNSDNEVEKAYFECEFNRDDLALISARFESAHDGKQLGRLPENAIQEVNRQRDEMLEAAGLEAVPSL